MTLGHNYNPSPEIKSVAIFGSADIDENSEVYKQAFEVSRLLAQQGYRVVNGGGPGVMQAATLGAKEAGGKTLTVTFAPENAPNFEGAAGINVADDTMVASDYTERVGMLIKNADAFVIFKGGTGTLSEWAMVWLLAHIYYGQHKPFVMVGDFWHEVIDMIKKHFLVDEVELKTFEVVSDVMQVPAALERLSQAKAAMQE